MKKIEVRIKNARHCDPDERGGSNLKMSKLQLTIKISIMKKIIILVVVIMAVSCNNNIDNGKDKAVKATPADTLKVDSTKLPQKP
jgi:hypothetical protein